jgi:hypothetical protein
MTNENHKNDLIDLINTSISELEQEYNRILKRVGEDPGTSGDQGEESWADLLRGWLPEHYHVKTKGRILNDRGEASKQFDVIVLRPSYSKNLLDKNCKLFLSRGVVAVFECKLTLNTKHIEEAVSRGVELKRLIHGRAGTPYRELNSPVIYGLLAHSHCWKKKKSKLIKNIEKNIISSDSKHVKHPREMMDILCVSDMATWNASKNIHFMTLDNVIIPQNQKEEFIMGNRNKLGPDGTIHTCYGCHSKEHPAQASHFSAIGSMLTYLLKKIAWENTELRAIADHFIYSQLEGCGTGQIRYWDSSEVLTPETRKQVLLNGPVYGYEHHWDEWKTISYF